jgi:peptide/nickel transport system substrate-binding protein
MKKLSRRVFLKFTGVVGLGTLAACVTPPTPEKIVEFQTQVVTQVVAGTPVEKIVTQIVAATAAPTATPKPTTAPLAGKSLLPVTTPREELFVADQIFRYGAPGNFNLHLPSSTTPHRHALMMETFWYRDQETGVRLYGVAKSDPVYNADFTSMKVDLRDNLAWSDGVAFNADDVVYTVQTIMGNNQLAWNPDLTLWVDSIKKTGDYSVEFTLKKSNPRFHSLFEARWNGVYMMPKHQFEKVSDLATFTNDKPVVLGAYLPIQFDPNGFWELYQIRDDWQKTPAGIQVGQPGPKYVLTLFYGDSTKKAIAMSRHELDVFFDADFEAFKSVIESTPTFRSWYTAFPWAYPNENDARHLSFNYEGDPLFKNKDVRWALNLALDVVDMQTNYIGGVAKVTAIPVSPSGSLMKLYHDQLEDWLTNLEIEIEPGTKYKPYDPTVPDQIAAWATKQGYTVPGKPRDVFGTGWWKYAPDVAERLLKKAGLKKDANGKWLTPEGKVWTIDLQSPPDENDAFRMANAAKDQWSKFGINVNLQGVERDTVWTPNNAMGQFGVTTLWYSFALANGDSWPQIQELRPDRYVPKGKDARTLGGWLNTMRIKDDKIGQFIDEMGKVNPDTEDNFKLVREFLKYWVENAMDVTQIGFKKFVTWDEQYWTGFPTSENPTYQPLYWFHGGKYTFEVIKPKT